MGKVTYSKLLQDSDTLESGGCGEEECSLDKEFNLRDRRELLALVEWLLKGLEPLQEPAEDSFTKFWASNAAAIEERLVGGSN